MSLGVSVLVSFQVPCPKPQNAKAVKRKNGSANRLFFINGFIPKIRKIDFIFVVQLPSLHPQKTHIHVGETKHRKFQREQLNIGKKCKNGYNLAKLICNLKQGY